MLNHPRHLVKIQGQAKADQQMIIRKLKDLACIRSRERDGLGGCIDSIYRLAMKLDSQAELTNRIGQVTGFNAARDHFRQQGLKHKEIGVAHQMHLNG